MSAKQNGKSMAFPLHGAEGPIEYGLTKREYAAVAVAASLAAHLNKDYSDEEINEIVKASVEVADAVLVRLETA